MLASQMTTITVPRILSIGAGASGKLAATLKSLGLKNPLIVTDRFLASQGWALRLQEGLTAAGLSSQVFADTVPDPTIASVEAALEILTRGRHDCLVGFGGGSPMDTAKALAVLAVHGGPLAKYKVPHVQDEPGLPVIAIPTTAGTGSEATRFTIVTDETSDEKMLCVGLAYLPFAALVDYELTLSMPQRLTADTGIDALTHALESYVSKRANGFSEHMSLLAMRAIYPHLRTAYFDPENRVARASVMLGATQAGIAFSNSSVALVHGMSRPIGAFFHVPHGLSNAMLLPAVTRYSAPAALERYAACARAMGVATDADNASSAVERLLAALESLNHDLEVPTPRDYGIDEHAWNSQLPVMAEQALASGSPNNNPRVPKAEDIQALYRSVWG